MKRILVLGATGAMGIPLIDYLSANPEYLVYATSRKKQNSTKINWIQGNGQDHSWVKQLLEDTHFDAIVDFLNYSTDSFKERYEFYLSHTDHYVFLSSARVYAVTEDIIDETFPRILDVCQEQDYLSGDTYDLAKARSEDLLLNSSYTNYTIVRPSLTYNSSRLQFCIFELNEWIYRVLDGNSIIFPKQLEGVYTTMTHGKDVAHAISKLLFLPESFGEVFNINGGGCSTWGDILKIYCKAIERSTNKTVNVCEVDNVEKIATDLGRYYQFKYARGISRRFSNDKLESVIGSIEWLPIEQGLTECIQQFIENGANINRPDFRKVAYFDRLAHELTPLRRFSSLKAKVGYGLCRFGLYK